MLENETVNETEVKLRQVISDFKSKSKDLKIDKLLKPYEMALSEVADLPINTQLSLLRQAGISLSYQGLKGYLTRHRLYKKVKKGSKTVNKVSPKDTEMFVS